MSLKTTISIPMRFLKVFMVLYLLLPNLLFHSYWFRTEVAVFTIPGLILTFYFYWSNQQKNEASEIDLSLGNLFILVGISLFLVSLSGIGGLSYQTNDFVGHNSKYYDLFQNKWPIYFESADTFGCYYWGFYLVPALISKIMGTLSVPVFFIWTFVGLFLGVVMVFLLVKRSITRLIVFFFIGGIGHTVKVIFGIISGLGFERPLVFVEVWNLLNQLLWAPNQFIPALIIASLIYYDGVIGKQIFSCLFPLTLGFIWAVFPSVVLSLILLVVWLYFTGFSYLIRIGARTFITSLVIPIVICLPVLVYFLSSSGAPIRGLLWTFEPLKPIVADYLACVIFDVVALGIAWKFLFDNRNEVSNDFFFGVLALVPLFGLYRFGYANDWLVRGTMPLFILLFLALLRGSLINPFEGNRKILTTHNIVFTCFLILCLVAPFSYFYRAAKNNVLTNLITGTENFKPYRYDTYPNIYEAVRQHHSEVEGAQYLGNQKSYYWRFLSKKYLN